MIRGACVWRKDALTKAKERAAAQLAQMTWETEPDRKS